VSLWLSGAAVLGLLLGAVLLIVLFSLLSVARQADACLEEFEEVLQRPTPGESDRVGTRDGSRGLLPQPPRRGRKMPRQPAVRGNPVS
jgi:hypothetical protein